MSKEESKEYSSAGVSGFWRSKTWTRSLFFEQIKIGNDVGSALDPGLEMFYFPKLTDEEMTLVENKDEDYLRTFFVYPHESPDIQEDIMKLSELKSKTSDIEWKCP